MKKWTPIFFLLVFAACKTTYPNEKKLTYTAPVKIGDAWAPKKALLGTPDKMGDNFSSYFSQGMIVYTNAEGVEVNGLVFTWFMGGAHFTGEIYGIRLGDTYPKASRLWGEPTESGAVTPDYYEKKWKFRKFMVSVQFWVQAGDDENLGGHYEADTVKRIQITT